MMPRLLPDFETPESHKKNLRVKIATVARRIDQYEADYKVAETDDERNFYALRIAMNQTILDGYNNALALMDQA